MKTKLYTQSGRYRIAHHVELEIHPDRIYFVQSPFALKDEIRAMQGARWHGFDDPPRKIWSVAHSPRNVFQINYLRLGEEVYAHFADEELPVLDPPGRPVMKEHQIDMVRRCLKYRFQILAAEQGLGKTMVAMEVIERVPGEWWYVGPRSALESVELEFKKWGFKGSVRTLTYQKLSNMVQNGEQFDIPVGVVFDESSNVKTPTANVSVAAQWLADSVREAHPLDAHIILMSGTPSAKRPSDLWKQAEIAFPGFLREGSIRAFEERYAIFEDGKDRDGVKFRKLVGWDESEVEALPSRLKGLMTTYRKDDWVSLPPRIFREVRLQPSKKVLRVAKSLADIAPSPIVALTWLRALSSGFQYTYTEEGGEKMLCPVCEGSKVLHDNKVCQTCGPDGHLTTKVRKVEMVKTPKDDALIEIVQSEHRAVVMGSFKGSIDRVKSIGLQLGFNLAVVDGDGWLSYGKDGKLMKDTKPLDLWEFCEEPVLFVGNPASCRYGLTLTKARKLVFYDNSFSAEHRLQAIDRVHRLGIVESPEIYDLIHLEIDSYILENLRENRKLELLSLGSIQEAVAGELSKVQ